MSRVRTCFHADCAQNCATKLCGCIINEKFPSKMDHLNEVDAVRSSSEFLAFSQHAIILTSGKMCDWMSCCN